MTGDLTVQTYLKLGAGSNGFFYSDTPGRTAFNSGDFYIQSSVNNFYNYATNQYYGNSSGNNILFRGNPLSGNNWNITASGVITATGGNSSNWNTAYGWGNHASAGYLLTSGKAADSNLLDGLDSTEFGRVTPSGTWYSFTDPLTDTSGFIDASWVNKFEFFDTSKITVETSTDDITYTVTTEYSDAQLKNLMGGDGNAGINIPNLGVIGTAYKRFTFTNNGYVSLSMLYEYVTRVTGTLDMKVEKRQVITMLLQTVRDILLTQEQLLVQEQLIIFLNGVGQLVKQTPLFMTTEQM
jgi:hypothetical protein